MRPAVLLLALLALAAGARAATVCVYCDADRNRKSYSLLQSLNCWWNEEEVTLEQINPLDLLINLGCPDEHEGMKLSQYIDGCPNPDDVTECPSPPTKICVYCDSNRNRKSYVVNGSAECDWQGETYSLDQLDGTSCPETVDEMTLAAELDSCPDAEAASECAA